MVRSEGGCGGGVRRGGWLNWEAQAKWDAWKAHEGMSAEDAMRAYIAEVEAQTAEFS